MGTVTLPYGKGAIDPSLVETVNPIWHRNQHIVKVIWKDRHKDPLLIPCDSPEQSKEIIEFIANATQLRIVELKIKGIDV